MTSKFKIELLVIYEIAFLGDFTFFVALNSFSQLYIE